MWLSARKRRRKHRTDFCVCGAIRLLPSKIWSLQTVPSNLHRINMTQNGRLQSPAKLFILINICGAYVSANIVLNISIIVDICSM